MLDEGPYIAHRGAVSRYLDVQGMGSLIEESAPLLRYPRRASARLQQLLWREIATIERGRRLSTAVLRYWRNGDDPTGQISLLAPTLRDAFACHARLKVLRDAFLRSETAMNAGTLTVTFKHELDLPAGAALAEMNMLIVCHSIGSAFDGVLRHCVFRMTGREDGSLAEVCPWLTSAVEYGAEWPSVTFPSNVFVATNAYADEGTLNFYVEALERDAAELRALVGSYSERTYAYVDSALPVGLPSGSQTAAFCGISLQELHDGLAEEGSSFEAICEAVRARAVKVELATPGAVPERVWQRTGFHSLDELVEFCAERDISIAPPYADWEEESTKITRRS